jgi:putative addiction module killer protein
VVTVSQTTEFRTWLSGVTDPIAFDAIVIRTVRMESGLMGDIKSIGRKVTEARIDVGQGYRLYYTKRGLEIVLLLCGEPRVRSQPTSQERRRWLRIWMPRRKRRPLRPGRQPEKVARRSDSEDARPWRAR